MEVFALRKSNQKLVEEALLKRALGYTYIEKREETGSDGKEKTVVTEKQSEPDVRSIMYWLTNRHPKRWKVRPLEDGADPMGKVAELVDTNRKAAEAALGGGGDCDDLQ